MFSWRTQEGGKFNIWLYDEEYLRLFYMSCSWENLGNLGKGYIRSVLDSKGGCGDTHYFKGYMVALSVKVN